MTHFAVEFIRQKIAQERFVGVRRIQNPVVVLGKTEQSRVQPFAGLVLRFKRVGMFWKTERTGAAQGDAGPAVVTRQARQRCTSAKRVNEPRIGANFYAVRDASAERVN